MARTIAQDVSHLVFTEMKFRLFQNNDQFMPWSNLPNDYIFYTNMTVGMICAENIVKIRCIV